jgi:2-polyprenyl-3-methyl-5-hydroxy-6-metoxy-1,4-benzoquinol methylase
MDMNSYETICNICSESKLHISKTIISPDRFESHTQNGAQYQERYWAQCSSCEAYVNLMNKKARLALEEISTDYYQIDFGDIDLVERFQKIMSLPKIGSDNALRVERACFLLSDMLPSSSKSLKVLDFGSGLGVFPALLLEKAGEIGLDLNIHVVETDKNALSVLDNIKNINIHPGLYNTDEHGKYDVIFLNKVLEHIKNPLLLLIDLKKNLAHQGLIYVEVPNHLNINRPTSDNAFSSLHYNFYNKSTFEFIGHEIELRLKNYVDIKEPSGKDTCYGVFTR